MKLEATAQLPAVLSGIFIEAEENYGKKSSFFEKANAGITKCRNLPK